MRRFVASAWFPFLTALLLGGAAVLAYAALQPIGSDVGNDELVRVFRMAGWGVGPVMAILSLLLMLLLNGIRHLMNLRQSVVMHGIVALAGTLPWFMWGWSLTGEPQHTKFAIAAIEFVGRPMLWGGLAATLVVLMLWALSLLSRSNA